MPWIRVIHEPEAEGELREAYGRVASARGRVADILKVHSLSPGAMTAHLALYRQRGTLRRLPSTRGRARS